MHTPNLPEDEGRNAEAIRVRALEHWVPLSQCGPRVLEGVAEMVARARARGLLPD